MEWHAALANGARSRIMPRFVFVATTFRVASTARKTNSPTDNDCAFAKIGPMAVADKTKSK